MLTYTVFATANFSNQAVVVNIVANRAKVVIFVKVPWFMGQDIRIDPGHCLDLICFEIAEKMVLFLQVYFSMLYN